MRTTMNPEGYLQRSNRVSARYRKLSAWTALALILLGAVSCVTVPAPNGPEKWAVDPKKSRSIPADESNNQTVPRYKPVD
jgi:hypothetical protein